MHVLHIGILHEGVIQSIVSHEAGQTWSSLAKLNAIQCSVSHLNVVFLLLHTFMNILISHFRIYLTRNVRFMSAF